MFRLVASGILVPCMVLALSACNGGGSSADDSTTVGNGAGGSGGTSSGSFVCANRSGNWSGYEKKGAVGSFNRVTGTWTVPSVSCPAGSNSSSAAWTGVGGGSNGDPTLIQAGTVQECNNGIPSYSAWWEALPAPSVDPNRLSTQSYDVKPGDLITVTVDGSSGIVWNIIIHNNQGWTFSTAVPYGTAGGSAEWIMEAPLSAGTSGAGQTDLSNYGRMVFSSLTANGTNPGLSTGDCVAMGTNNSVASNPSRPGANGDAFAVCFGPGGCQ